MSSVTVLTDVDGRSWHVPSDVIGGATPGPAPRVAQVPFTGSVRPGPPLGPAAMALPIAVAVGAGAAAQYRPTVFAPLPFLPAPPRFYGPPVVYEQPEGPPPPLWLRVLVSPFAFLWLIIKWGAYALCVWLPQSIGWALSNCCEAIGPACSHCIDSTCMCCYDAGRACCSVVRSVEHSAGAPRR